MEEASESLEFERAIEYRELINSVQKIAQKQKITDTAGDDRDIVAVSKDKGRDTFQFYQAILCRDTIYSGTDYVARGNTRS